MRAPFAAATLLAVLAGPLAVTAVADGHDCKEARGICGRAGDGDFGVGSEQGGGGGGGSGGGGNGGVKPVKGPAPTTYVETRHVPTCTGNTVEDAGVLCGAAVDTCTTEGEIRFWVYRREVTIATGRATDWERAPDTVCLGGDAPELDPAAAVPALVQREFKRVVVLKGEAEVSPSPETLVNVPTRFRTPAPESYDIPLTLLGQSVVITARAERWTWVLGDGTSKSTTARGTGGYVEHAYRTTATREAHVEIEWSGTFRVNGGAPRPILGTATTTGDPAEVVVREAHTELVRD